MVLAGDARKGAKSGRLRRYHGVGGDSVEASLSSEPLYYSTLSQSCQQLLSASRFDGWNGRQIRGDLVRLEGLYLQGNQTERRHAGLDRATRAVHGHGNADDLTPVFADDVQGFLNAPSFGDHVFDDQDSLASGNLEPAPQRQFASPLLHEDKPQAKLPGDFLAEHQAAHSGGDNRHRSQRTDFPCQFRTELLDDRHPLQGQRALKVLAAVQSAAEHKMAFQQRAALVKDLQDFVPGHASNVKSGGPGAKRKVIPIQRDRTASRPRLAAFPKAQGRGD